MCEDISLWLSLWYITFNFSPIDTDGAGQWRIRHTQDTNQTETESESCIKLICVICKVQSYLLLYKISQGFI